MRKLLKPLSFKYEPYLCTEDHVNWKVQAEFIIVKRAVLCTNKQPSKSLSMVWNVLTSCECFEGGKENKLIS